MADKTYNGWTNYETWAVNLWLSNDECSQRRVDRMTAEAWVGAEEIHGLADEDLNERSCVARSNLSDYLQEIIDEDMPDLGGTLYADLLGSAMSEVDWVELADSYLRDADLNPKYVPLERFNA